jgi:methylated-DNA-[protein]-cysteine S-methyltransferase
MQSFYKTVSSPVGELTLVCSAGSLLAVLWEDEPLDQTGVGESEPGNDHPLLLEAAKQLGGYFAGKRRRFDLPLPETLPGTPFQRRVWSAMRLIPYGQTLSYGELAHRIGSPAACRAVGGACGKNPLPIIIPCHRVIGQSGGLTGFGGGLEKKRYLLALEKSPLKRGEKKMKAGHEIS